MKKILAAVLLGGAALAAQADELYVHTVSYHIDKVNDRGERFNNFNPGLGYRTDSGWMAGAFMNSYKDTSVYVAKEFMYNKNLGGVLGLGTGYDDHVEGVGFLRPIIAGVIKLPIADGYSANLLIMPNVLHLIASKKF